MTTDTWMRDQIEIRSLIESYSDACCQRDPEALMALWSDDCRWSVPDMEGLENIAGKDAIRAMWVGAQALFPIVFLTCTPGAITILGSEAKARVFTSEVTKNCDGVVKQAVGRYDDRLIRHDGRWLFQERVWREIHRL